MANLVKMVIYGYKDEKYNTKASPESFTLQVNPTSIKYGKDIEQSQKKPRGRQYNSPQYSGHKEMSFNFDTILDATGVISKLEGGIDSQIENIENLVYNINGEVHKPNYLKISWGTFLFKGVLKSINYDYTLFSPEGSPLRVKISFSLTGFMDRKQANQKEGKTSPDLSHLITIKSGDSLAAICNEIYDDPSYCIDVAKHNNLSSFRNIKPGTQIMFPQLNRDGRISK